MSYGIYINVVTFLMSLFISFVIPTYLQFIQTPIIDTNFGISHVLHLCIEILSWMIDIYMNSLIAHPHLLVHVTTQNMIFSVTYCSELHVPISFYYECICFYQVKMLMLYSQESTNSTTTGKKNEMHNRH
jgi:hypothetical protein